MSSFSSKNHLFYLHSKTKKVSCSQRVTSCVKSGLGHSSYLYWQASQRLGGFSFKGPGALKWCCVVCLFGPYRLWWDRGRQWKTEMTDDLISPYLELMTQWNKISGLQIYSCVLCNFYHCPRDFNLPLTLYLLGFMTVRKLSFRNSHKAKLLLFPWVSMGLDPQRITDSSLDRVPSYVLMCFEAWRRKWSPWRKKSCSIVIHRWIFC